MAKYSSSFINIIHATEIWRFLLKVCYICYSLHLLYLLQPTQLPIPQPTVEYPGRIIKRLTIVKALASFEDWSRFRLSFSMVGCEKQIFGHPQRIVGPLFLVMRPLVDSVEGYILCQHRKPKWYDTLSLSPSIPHSITVSLSSRFCILPQLFPQLYEHFMTRSKPTYF